VSVRTVKARVASTHPVEKYPGWHLSAEALEEMAEHLRSGDIPMLFDHDARERIEARVLDAQVVPPDQGHSALDVVFEVDAEAWEGIQDRFADAGAPGGFSFSATVPQVAPKSGDEALVILAADAAAWTDRDRAEAGALLDAVVPTQTDRLFQYSGLELATIFLVLAEGVGLGVLGNVVYDALRRLLSRRKSETRIEIHRRSPDGRSLKAIVTTSDPEIAREALETLSENQEAPTAHFDTDTRRWLNG
jgi:hypothetical protein